MLVVLKNRQELDLRILDILHENAEHLDGHKLTDILGKLGTLIRGIRQNMDNAVVLVDEYDKPILDKCRQPTCCC
ncbi:hypothetical protein U9R62_10240 [Cylindrospermopsis raciborskii DSH]